MVFGLLTIIKQWKDQCRSEGVDLMSWQGGNRLVKRIAVAGYQYICAVPGASLGLVYFGPIGAVVGAVLSGCAGQKMLEFASKFQADIRNWWCRTREHEQALRDLGISPDTDLATFDQISDCLDGR